MNTTAKVEKLNTEICYEWRHIETAPLEGKFDVWAKRWIAKDDDFEYRRFTDCFWRGTHVGNCPKEWKPTHWFPIPPGPYGA